MTILLRSVSINIKQFLKFKMRAFKHLVRKKYLFRQMKKNIIMRKIIDDLTIKTQILETMHEKFDHKKRNLSEIATKYF